MSQKTEGVKYIIPSASKVDGMPEEPSFVQPMRRAMAFGGNLSRLFDYIDALRQFALAAARDAWIPVAERLPRPYDSVLAYDATDGECVTAAIVGGLNARPRTDQYWINHSKPGADFYPSHWQPIPAPPAIDQALATDSGGRVR